VNASIWSRQAETVNACFRTAAFTVTGTTSDYLSNRGQRQPHATGGSVPTCATPLFSEAEARPHLIFCPWPEPSTIRTSPKPAMTIWTSSAPRWACIDADLPQVEKQPPPAA